MIFSVSRHSFSDEMNDIRLRLLAIFRLTPLKSIHRACQTSLGVCLITPFFSPLYLVAQNGGQTLRLTGFCPSKRNTFTGLPSLGRVIRFGSVFSFLRWTPIRIKKAYRPRFIWLVKSFLATKQVCDFQRFRIVLFVSLHDVKKRTQKPAKPF